MYMRILKKNIMIGKDLSVICHVYSPYHYECKYCGNKTFITVKPKMKRK